MGTKEFNVIDKLISRMRLGKVLPYIRKHDAVLDFGCGHQAYLLNHLSTLVSEAIGIDYDVVEKSIAPHIETRKFKFTTRLPFTDKKFHDICMLAVLEHIEPAYTGKLFREFHRVLKPGGRIILTTPTPKSKVLLEYTAKLHFISKDEVEDHKKYYDRGDINTLCKNYDLKLIRYETFWFGMNSFAVIEKI